MNAQSAGSRPAQRPTQPNPSTSGSAAKNATASSSSRAEKETLLVDGLKLTIRLHIRGDQQWLRMSLEDELNLDGVTIDAPILCSTPQKRYHLQEATVVGMRRLMHEAFEEGLISDSPGELMTVLKSPPVPRAPMPTHSEDDSAQSLTDLGSL